jgi:hypothetical protein
MRDCQEFVSFSPMIPVLGCSTVTTTARGAEYSVKRFLHMPIKVLGLCGSARRDSLNRKLLEIALFGARDAGADVTQIRLKDAAAEKMVRAVGAALVELATRFEPSATPATHSLTADIGIRQIL